MGGEVDPDWEQEQLLPAASGPLPVQLVLVGPGQQLDFVTQHPAMAEA